MRKCSAAAKAGRSVLQLEKEGEYGGLWASLTLDEFRKVVTQGSPTHGSLYGGKIYEVGSSEELGPPRGYSLDISPHVIHGVGPLIKMLLGSGAHNYTEYKLIKTTIIRDPRTGKAQSVPCSRAEIFRDQNLSPLQKRTLMRFLKTYISTALTQTAQTSDTSPSRFTCSGDVSFISLLNEIEGMDETLQRCILHGVLLQPELEQEGDAVVTCQTAARLIRMYTNSLGRYGIDAGPFLVPMHGFGELPQAFCRTAAVHGAVQVLRCGVERYEYDGSAQMHRVILNNETKQELKSHFVAASHQFRSTMMSGGSRIFLDAGRERCKEVGGSQLRKKAIHRCIAIVTGPTQLTPEAQALLILPSPLHAMKDKSGFKTIWGLQLGPGNGVTPSSTWLLHLWCESHYGDVGTAEQALLPCINTLVDFEPRPSSPSPYSLAVASADANATLNKALPRALWVAFFSLPIDSTSISLNTPAPKGFVFCPGPTAEVGCVEATDIAKRLYFEMLYGPDSEVSTKYSNPAVDDEQVTEDEFPLSPEFVGNKNAEGEDRTIDSGDTGMEELTQELAALHNALGLDSGEGGTSALS